MLCTYKNLPTAPNSWPEKEILPFVLHDTTLIQREAALPQRSWGNAKEESCNPREILGHRANGRKAPPPPSILIWGASFFFRPSSMDGRRTAGGGGGAAAVCRSRLVGVGDQVPKEPRVLLLPVI